MHETAHHVVSMRVNKTQDDDTRGVSWRLLRERQILALIPVSRATFRRWLRDGTFPAGFRLCGRIAVWHASDVHAWIEQRSPPGPRGNSP